MKKINNIKELINERLSNDYIAGFVHGDGGFSVQISLSKTKDSTKFKLLPMFTLTQHIRNEEIMKEIITRLGNKGSYSIDNKNIMRYRLSNIKDFKEELIPFFDKYQLKKDKLKNYIKLKFIVEKLLTIDSRLRWFSYDLYNEYNNLILNLIIISVNMNMNVKSSIHIDRLSLKDKERILKNELSSEIKQELYDYIKNYNYKNDLNIDFINGLFDSDGWITLRITINKRKNNNIFIGLEYGIVSDILNSELLYDIKDYFNGVGSVKKRTDENSISYIITKTEFLSKVLPKLYNLNNLEELENIKTKGSIIKDYKIKVILNILNLYDEYKNIKKKDEGKIILEKILLLSYEIRDINLKNKESLNNYLIRMKEKLNI